MAVPGTRSRAAVADPSGSLLLVVALGVLVVVTWQPLPLVVPMLGWVVMAAVPIERRHVLIMATRRPDHGDPAADHGIRWPDHGGAAAEGLIDSNLE